MFTVTSGKKALAASGYDEGEFSVPKSSRDLLNDLAVKLVKCLNSSNLELVDASRQTYSGVTEGGNLKKQKGKKIVGKFDENSLRELTTRLLSSSSKAEEDGDDLALHEILEEIFDDSFVDFTDAISQVETEAEEKKAASKKAKGKKGSTKAKTPRVTFEKKVGLKGILPISAFKKLVNEELGRRSQLSPPPSESEEGESSEGEDDSEGTSSPSFDFSKVFRAVENTKELKEYFAKWDSDTEDFSPPAIKYNNSFVWGFKGLESKIFYSHLAFVFEKLCVYALETIKDDVEASEPKTFKGVEKRHVSSDLLYSAFNDIGLTLSSRDSSLVSAFDFATWFNSLSDEEKRNCKVFVKVAEGKM